MWEGNGLPADILGGIGLSTLDHIRTTWQVYVDWDSDLKALRVSAERRADDEDNVTLALAGIRQAIKNEKAAGGKWNWGLPNLTCCHLYMCSHNVALCWNLDIR